MFHVLNWTTTLPNRFVGRDTSGYTVRLFWFWLVAIVELIVKQRDVYKTSALMVTHRLQDAFTMATHEFDKDLNKMVPLPKGKRSEVPLSFLILRDGKIIFDGDLPELAASRDPYIREYIS